MGIIESGTYTNTDFSKNRQTQIDRDSITQEEHWGQGLLTYSGAEQVRAKKARQIPGRFFKLQLALG